MYTEDIPTRTEYELSPHDVPCPDSNHHTLIVIPAVHVDSVLIKKPHHPDTPSRNTSFFENQVTNMATTTLTSLVAIAATTTTGPNGLLTAFPAATQAASTTDGPSNDGSDEKGECRLLGSFSLLIQAALGALALLSLVYKRWRERPQRPIKVWAFDVSKQVFGSAMLHLLNLLMSMFSAGQFELQSSFKPNPCSFYLLNLGIDVSFLRSSRRSLVSFDTEC